MQTKAVPAIPEIMNMMKKIAKIDTFIYKNINYIAAYLSTLYFFEVISIMVATLLSYGKVTASIVGMFLTIVYTIHIIRIYFRKNVNRIVQLIIMDIHIAYITAFLINMYMQDSVVNIFVILITVIRAIMVVVEIPLLYFLSSPKAIKQFQLTE